MLEENKSLAKQVATRIVPPSKLMAQQNPLEFIPVATPQPEATRQGKLNSGTQMSFPKALYGKSLWGGNVCRGRRGCELQYSHASHGHPKPGTSDPLNAGSLFSSTHPNEPLHRFPR